MPDFVSDGTPFEPSESGATQDYASTAPSFGEGVGAMFGQLSTTGMLWRAAQRHTAARESAGLYDEQDPQLSSQLEEQKIPAAQANSQYAPEGANIFDAPVYPRVAKLIGDAKAAEMAHEATVARYSQAHSWPVNFGTGVAAFIIDPVNAASTFVPGLGEDSILAGAARIGVEVGGAGARVGARVVAGATAGAVAQIPLSGLRYGLGQQEASDYGLRDAFNDVLFSAAGGAIFHAGLGTASEFIRGRSAPVINADATTKYDAMKSAVSQMADGREVDVAPVYSAFHPQTMPEAVAPGYSRELADREDAAAPSESPDIGPQYHAMSLSDLDQHIKWEGESDAEKLVRALGEDGAKKFTRLDRARNSMDPQRADEASRLFDQEFGDLTPEQERLVYGTHDPNTLSLEGLRQVRAARELAEFIHEVPDAELGRSLSRSMLDVSPDEVSGVMAGTERDPFKISRAIQAQSAIQEIVERRGSFDAAKPLIADAMEARGYSARDAGEVLDKWSSLTKPQSSRRQQARLLENKYQSPSDLAQSQATIRETGYGSGVPQPEFDASHAEIYGKPEPEEEGAQGKPEGAAKGTEESPEETQLAELERQHAASGGRTDLTAEERAELTRTAQATETASAYEQAAQEAASCLSATGGE